MTVVSPTTIPGHIDFLVMQIDHEHAIVRDIVFAVLAFNRHTRGEPLQISFPLYTDTKVTDRGVLGPCVRVTGPPEKLYVLTLRHEIAAHLRAGRAMTFTRDRVVIEAGRNERFTLVSSTDEAAKSPIKLARARPLVLGGQSRLIETAGQIGVAVQDEAAFVTRGESETATDGTVDLLGFSDDKTLPVLK